MFLGGFGNFFCEVMNLYSIFYMHAGCLTASVYYYVFVVLYRVRNGKAV